MCGRFGLSDTEQMERRFGVEATERLSFEPTYNAAPGQTLPVIVPEASGRTLSFKRWGLVPSWTLDEKIGSRLINARSETATKKPSFRAALRERRCLVPANWFYEWKGDRGAKIPHVIRRRDGGLFAMAGLYETWQRPDGEALRTFAVLTRSPNSLVASIHDRMPVMLRESEEETWLSAETDPGRFLHETTPYPADEMEAYPVSRLVNSARNNSPELIQRLAGA